MKLATRVNRIKPSPTLAITAKANALRAQGRDIIGFGAGEPDFDTPDHIKNAGIRAIQEGFTKYTPVGGTDELKDAIAGKLETENGLTYGRSNIVVSCGAKHTLYNLAQALFEKGDEVIVPAPFWVSYPDIIVLADAAPVILQTREEDGFKMTPQALRQAITPSTRAVIVNSPSNPTGTTYTLEELRALGEVLAETDILVISDDIYEKVLYDGFVFSNMANTGEDMKARTIVVNGVSKAYAMTGWRIGYAAGPEEVITAVSNIQSQNTSNPTSISQKASVAALRETQGPTEKMVTEFRKRRDFIVSALNDIPSVTCRKPEGAFYVFPNVAGLYGRKGRERVIGNSLDLAAFLLDEADVAVVPGSAFGDDRYIRLSYATSMRNIEEGVKRIRSAVSRLA